MSAAPPAPVGSLGDGRPRAVQDRAVVLDNQVAGAYRHLVLRTAPAAAAARPGQFVAVAVGADPGAPTATLLRRAFSVHRASPDGPDGPTVEIVVAPRGPGSTWVTRRRALEQLDLVGPLGRPFPLPAPDAAVVLVGGGYGSVPLDWWARVLRRRGHRVSMVLGAGDAQRLFRPADVREQAEPVFVTTEDGSAGRRGRVTDVLPPLLSPGVQVYACGPMAMLRAVTALAAERGAGVWCAVEESMACGIGVCMTCVLPITGRDGVTRMTRTCVEGPTVDGVALRWDAIGAGPGGGSAVPADCLGAPRPAGPAGSAGSAGSAGPAGGD